METTEYRFGNPNDKGEITRLLSSLNLPYKYIEQHLNNFIVATVQDRIVGCIAAELYGEHCLLRSLAVDEEFRSNGIGKQLYNYIFSFVYENGVTNIHLLTETAEHYFQKLGFVTTGRQNAPEKIRSTSAFTSLYPPGGIYMVNAVSKTTPKFFKSNLHKLKKDSQTDSKYWSVKSENMMFTWFEVPPEKVFAAHSHESEQMTYVLKGELYFEIEREMFCLRAGYFISIPSNKIHKVWTEAQGANAVDSWSPPNNNY